MGFCSEKTEDGRWKTEDVWEWGGETCQRPKVLTEFECRGGER